MSKLNEFFSGGIRRIQDRNTPLNFLLWVFLTFQSYSIPNWKKKCFFYFLRRQRHVNLNPPICISLLLEFQASPAVCCQYIGLERTFSIADLKLLEEKMRFSFWRLLKGEKYSTWPFNVAHDILRESKVKNGFHHGHGQTFGSSPKHIWESIMLLFSIRQLHKCIRNVNLATLRGFISHNLN